jgi:hypothetical protein
MADFTVVLPDDRVPTQDQLHDLAAIGAVVDQRDERIRVQHVRASNGNVARSLVADVLAADPETLEAEDSSGGSTRRVT